MGFRGLLFSVKNEKKRIEKRERKERKHKKKGGKKGFKSKMRRNKTRDKIRKSLRFEAFSRAGVLLDRNMAPPRGRYFTLLLWAATFAPVLGLSLGSRVVVACACYSHGRKRGTRALGGENSVRGSITCSNCHDVKSFFWFEEADGSRREGQQQRRRRRRQR